jgi:hypothetical protein
MPPRSPPDVVVVVARFASTLLEVARIDHGDTYRVGSAPDVDLPLDVSPLTTFPLVGSTADGFVVRCPVGVPATCVARDGQVSVAERELRLEPGMRVELTLGRVALTIARDAAAAPLARRAIDRRPYGFAVVSFVLHLIVLTIAHAEAELDPITIPVAIVDPAPRPAPPHARLARLPAPRPARRPSHARALAATPSTSPATPATHPEPATPRSRPGRADGPRGGLDMLGGLGDLSAITGTKDLAAELADLGPIYDQEAANRDGFGNANGRFDPARDPAFDSVKTGRYATVATGPGAGAHYDLPGAVARPPIMGLTCDDDRCVADGSFDRHAVRDVIERRYVQLIGCFERHARRAPRVELTLRFDIEPDGSTGGVRADEAGRVGSCVARIVERVKFPTTARATRVTYPMAFWRT